MRSAGTCAFSPLQEGELRTPPFGPFSLFFSSRTPLTSPNPRTLAGSGASAHAEGKPAPWVLLFFFFGTVFLISTTHRLAAIYGDHLRYTCEREEQRQQVNNPAALQHENTRGGAPAERGEMRRFEGKGKKKKKIKQDQKRNPEAEGGSPSCALLSRGDAACDFGGDPMESRAGVSPVAPAISPCLPRAVRLLPFSPLHPPPRCSFPSFSETL